MVQYFLLELYKYLILIVAAEISDHCNEWYVIFYSRLHKGSWNKATKVCGYVDIDNITKIDLRNRKTAKFLCANKNNLVLVTKQSTEESR